MNMQVHRSTAVSAGLCAFVLAFAVVLAFGASQPSQAQAAQRPSKVKAVSVKATSSSSVKVTWKKAARAQRYEIRYAKKKSMAAAKLKSASKAARSKTVKGLKASTTYYVQVRACRLKGAGRYGAWSAVKTVATKAPEGSRSNPYAASKGVVLKEGAVSYKVTKTWTDGAALKKLQDMGALYADDGQSAKRDDEDGSSTLDRFRGANTLAELEEGMKSRMLAMIQYEVSVLDKSYEDEGFYANEILEDAIYTDSKGEQRIEAICLDDLAGTVGDKSLTGSFSVYGKGTKATAYLVLWLPKETKGFLCRAYDRYDRHKDAAVYIWTKYVLQ